MISTVTVFESVVFSSGEVTLTVRGYLPALMRFGILTSTQTPISVPPEIEMDSRPSLTW